MIAEELVEQLRDNHGHRLVRRVIVRNDWVAQAVFDIAAGDRKEWNPRDWRILFKHLRASPLYPAWGKNCFKPVSRDSTFPKIFFLFPAIVAPISHINWSLWAQRIKIQP